MNPPVAPEFRRYASIPLSAVIYDHADSLHRLCQFQLQHFAATTSGNVAFDALRDLWRNALDAVSPKLAWASFRLKLNICAALRAARINRIKHAHLVLLDA
jgi:hypothetical protein